MPSFEEQRKQELQEALAAVTRAERNVKADELTLAASRVNLQRARYRRRRLELWTKLEEARQVQAATELELHQLDKEMVDYNRRSDVARLGAATS